MNPPGNQEEFVEAIAVYIYSMSRLHGNKELELKTTVTEKVMKRLRKIVIKKHI